ncbi:SRPBCC domain-containing protein [Actinophytocola sp.]|jgi:hypothetical protein|uniref:SRPBCC family protein n=1 Tax=Actinophytocola sp. TaxID=1872138 RepID=UPI002ED8980B
MSAQSFTTAVSVDQTPQEAFDAINDVRGWWSRSLEGRTEHRGDEFTYRYEDLHRCTIRVTEAVPGKKVSWLVLDNYFNSIQDPEWTGTTIEFDISEKDGETEVRFTHLGLVPEFECFDACSDGWTFYVNNSLRDLITTGEGQPSGSEQPSAAAEAVTARDR